MSSLERHALRLEVEEFLYHEADLLDRWDLEPWLELFTEDGQYSVPPTDRPDADPRQHTFLIHDDRFLLGQRVKSLLIKTAHAEWPHSRTRRLVTNVRASEDDAGVDVVAAFAVYRMRYDLVDTYVGTYRHHLVRGDAGQLLFRHRIAVLDLEALRPQAKVSIIL
ncbi:MAG: p-cumate dioxygenase [Acidimicrobiia bacterium]|nr:p-cumate dioxygenase [Acidimicrobiia bacterium]